jgi:hypothetical protein
VRGAFLAWEATLMERLFLSWVAALVAASWVGITLAEASAFGVVPVLAAAALAATCVLLALRGTGPFVRTRARYVVPLLAIALTATLLPAVDTTLLSQDASIHRASGRWLAASGGLGIPDDTFAALSEDDRLQLFGGGSASVQRISLTRLPGGIVLPDLTGTVAYPSFSHLLAVWVAIADRVGGEPAIAVLGPLFAATAWWAIGLVALLDAGLLAALAAPLLLAVLLPEHWFARYLMPEILAQALVWSGVAASLLAAAAHAPRARRTAAILCGVALGASAFARLEQFWVFVPALLLTRALLPRDRRLFPHGALLPFVVVATHALVHAFLVPTDYANRIYKLAIEAYVPFVVTVSTLTGHNGYTTGFLLNRALPATLLLGLAGWIWLGRRIDRTRPGFLRRWTAAAIALPWLALLYRDGMPQHFAALRSVLLYVPWPIAGAIGLGLLRARRWAGLEIALALQALDQLVQARVTDLQPWASRRVVTVVLPVLVLAAVRALAPLRAAGRARTLVTGDDQPPESSRPLLERRVAVALVCLTIVLGALRIAPLVGRPVQAGAEDLVRRVSAAVPPSSYVILGEPLAWVHLAPALWLEGGPTTLVAREQEWFGPALARFLAVPAMQDRPLYVLSGSVAAPDAQVDPLAVAPPLPADFTLEQVETFRWPILMLEPTVERRPGQLATRTLDLALYRVVRPPAAARSVPDPGVPANDGTSVTADPSAP